MVVKVLAGQAGSILSQARGAAWLPELPPKGNAPVSPYISEILEYLEVQGHISSLHTSVSICPDQQHKTSASVTQAPTHSDIGSGISPSALLYSSESLQQPQPAAFPCDKAPGMIHAAVCVACLQHGRAHDAGGVPPHSVTGGHGLHWRRCSGPAAGQQHPRLQPVCALPTEQRHGQAQGVRGGLRHPSHDCEPL